MRRARRRRLFSFPPFLDLSRLRLFFLRREEPRFSDLGASGHRATIPRRRWPSHAPAASLGEPVANRARGFGRNPRSTTLARRPLTRGGGWSFGLPCQLCRVPPWWLTPSFHDAPSVSSRPTSGITAPSHVDRIASPSRCRSRSTRMTSGSFPAQLSQTQSFARYPIRHVAGASQLAKKHR